MKTSLWWEKWEKLQPAQNLSTDVDVKWPEAFKKFQPCT